MDMVPPLLLLSMGEEAPCLPAHAREENPRTAIPSFYFEYKSLIHNNEQSDTHHRALTAGSV